MTLTNQQRGYLDTEKEKNLTLKLESRSEIYADDLSRFVVTIGKPQEEVFRFFRDFRNLPIFMKDLKSIQVQSPTRSHWIVELDLGLSAEWEAEIIAERKNEMIAWNSLENSEVKTSGTIWFRPAPRGLGTVVSLILDYSVPGGKLTEWLTKLKGEDPESLAFINLRRLKCFLETGELATVIGQSSGRAEDLEKFKH